MIYPYYIVFRKRTRNLSKSPGTLEVMVTSLQARGTAFTASSNALSSWLVRFYMKEAIVRFGLFESYMETHKTPQVALYLVEYK